MKSYRLLPAAAFMALAVPAAYAAQHGAPMMDGGGATMWGWGGGSTMWGMGSGGLLVVVLVVLAVAALGKYLISNRS